MVAADRADKPVTEKVGQVYEWLGVQVKQHSELAGRCRQCGKCCDFDSYDHRLFITTPEIIYLKSKLGVDNLKEMVGGICPYNKEGKCTVHKHRFCGCRVFCCSGDKDFQSELIEKAIKKFKQICDKYQIEYRYGDLKDFGGE